MAAQTAVSTASAAAAAAEAALCGVRPCRWVKHHTQHGVRRRASRDGAYTFTLEGCMRTLRFEMTGLHQKLTDLRLLPRLNNTRP